MEAEYTKLRRSIEKVDLEMRKIFTLSGAFKTLKRTNVMLLRAKRCDINALELEKIDNLLLFKVGVKNANNLKSNGWHDEVFLKISKFCSMPDVGYIRNMTKVARDKNYKKFIAMQKDVLLLGERLGFVNRISLSSSIRFWVRVENITMLKFANKELKIGLHEILGREFLGRDKTFLEVVVEERYKSSAFKKCLDWVRSVGLKDFASNEVWRLWGNSVLARADVETESSSKFRKLQEADQWFDVFSETTPLLEWKECAEDPLRRSMFLYPQPYSIGKDTEKLISTWPQKMQRKLLGRYEMPEKKEALSAL